MKRRVGFLIGLVLELIAIFGLFIPYVWLTSNGTRVTLQTVPVDPRSIFRGDYIVLAYEVGQEIPAQYIKNEWQQSYLYVVLEQKGEFYERVSVSETMPKPGPGQVCLRGLLQPWNRTLSFPDLSQYFVEEGLGRELEQMVRTHRFLVDAAVNESCRAVIRGVRIGPEASMMSPFPERLSEPRSSSIPE